VIERRLLGDTSRASDDVGDATATRRDSIGGAMPAPRVELLKRVPFLAKAGESELVALAPRFTERRYGSGSPVTSGGSSGVGFFVVAEGRATVRLHGEAVRRIGPGDHFGEIALVDGGRRSAEIVADTNMLCLGIPASELRTFVKSHPEVAWALLEHVVHRLRETEARAAAGQA
jgi:CRP-like cAMP-binding protein